MVAGRFAAWLSTCATTAAACLSYAGLAALAQRADIVVSRNGTCEVKHGLPAHVCAAGRQMGGVPRGCGCVHIPRTLHSWCG